MNDEHMLSHRYTWEMIPWVVNATAKPAERLLVEEHLRVCADCRDEFDRQRQLHAGIHADPLAARDPRPVLHQLLARIDDTLDADDRGVTAVAPGMPVAASRRPAERRAGMRWNQALAAAVVAQAIGLALLGTVLWQRTPAAASAGSADAPYVTLSQAADPARPAAIRFVPAATLTVGAMQAMLADAQLYIVQSSDDGRIYSLATLTPGDNASSPAAIDSAIARLRAQPGVLLAEPIGRSGAAQH